MRRLGRFFILAAIGFVLGGALAYFQGLQAAKNAAPQQAEAPAMETPAENGPIPVPENLAAITGGTSAPEGVPVPAEAAIAEETTAPSEAVVPQAEPDVNAEVAVEKEAAPEALPAETTAGSGVGGAFALTDHNGQAVTDKSWPGKHKLVFFGFTHCPDICPTTLDKLTTALNAMGSEAGQVQPLFVTTDAGRDTPEVMKAYIGGYHPSIVGLTGTEEQLKAAQDAYKVYAAKVPGVDANTYTMDHSAFVFLMSPEDKLLEIFKKDDTAEDMAAKMKAHVAAAPPAPEPAELPAEVPAPAAP